MIKRWVICALLLAVNLVSYSQATTDSQLAAHYFQNGEFDKAAMYYERLYNKDHSAFHYSYYLKCLYELEDFKRAESLAKQHTKYYPSNYTSRVDLGVIYQKQGKTKQANKEFDKLINNVVFNYSSVKSLADAFIGLNDYERALRTYKKGVQGMKGYPFNVDIAEVYALQKDYDNMVDELLKLLDINPGYLSSVQSTLSKYASFEKGSNANTALKSRLIKKINQNPNQTLYSELLLWLYQQEGNWRGALVQTKAIDKRKKLNGQFVYSIAETLLNNEQYDLAIEACDYIQKLGEESPYYIESRILALETRHQKITKSGNYNQNDITLLLADYRRTLADIGRNSSTISLMREMGGIQAFYQHNLDSGMTTFEEVLEIAGANEHERALVKLDYGDALLIAGYIWDASLMYGQVDKSFKYDRLGEVAKLKNAEVNFYTGNFSLAKAQLDILKGSTSKLIANDAMDLSITITDNSTIDTSTVPLQLFADAKLLLRQHKTIESVQKLDSINSEYPGHALEDDVLFMRYEIAYSKEEFDNAKQHLESIISGYSYDILADKALFKLADLNENELDNIEKAKELYQIILIDYKDSLYSTEARKRYRRLRGDQIN
jgi:lipopolysaccharide biosynthesis regulator YciM